MINDLSTSPDRSVSPGVLLGRTGRSLLLHTPEWAPRANEMWSFAATLDLGELYATTRVKLSDPGAEEPLPAVLTDLASRWRGWSGTRSWSAYEGGLSLEFTHDGRGTVHVMLKLQERSGQGWVVIGHVQVDAGALDELAASARSMFHFAPNAT